MTKRILFKETKPESLWSIFVDNELVEDNLRSDEMDISDPGMAALWKALDVDVRFENHPDG